MFVLRSHLSAARCSIFLILACAVSVRADVLLLKTGGRVEGKLTNPQQEPRTEYVLELQGGGQLTLEADQVARVVLSSPDELRYLALLKKMPPTADGNWKMAEWCRKKQLQDQHTFHLEEAIALDPNHESARRGLGHVRLDGKWGEPEQLMLARGYVQYKGRWRLPQDVALIKQREKNNLAAKQWTKNIKRWRNWIGKKRHDEALANLAQIRDPLATDGIIELLVSERNVQLQQLFIELLGRLHTTPALKALIDLALGSDRLETRELCLDQLEEHGRDISQQAFLAKLKSGDNLTVRRAAWALQRVADATAIEPLIDALVTTHRFKIQAGGPGQLSASRGTASDGSSGGLGFGVSGRPKIIDRKFENREVLDALLPLAHGANYRFDQAAWKTWYLRQTTPEIVDLRRGL